MCRHVSYELRTLKDDTGLLHRFRYSRVSHSTWSQAGSHQVLLPILLSLPCVALDYRCLRGYTQLCACVLGFELRESCVASALMHRAGSLALPLLIENTQGDRHSSVINESAPLRRKWRLRCSLPKPILFIPHVAPLEEKAGLTPCSPLQV